MSEKSDCFMGYARCERTITFSCFTRQLDSLLDVWIGRLRLAKEGNEAVHFRSSHSLASQKFARLTFRPSPRSKSTLAEGSQLTGYPYAIGWSENMKIRELG